jgi:peptidoglycan/LPS O-acetylase OafA/YrhL
MTYRKQIDGLRFVAVFLVLIEHFTPANIHVIPAGSYGVDLFFVISGFLITSILIKPNELSFLQNYKNFIGRRTLRIFPIYYLTIVVLFVAGYGVIREYLPWFLTYTYNYAHMYYKLPYNAVSHFWTLAVEEQFYLLWPFIALACRNRPKALLCICIGIILLGNGQKYFHVIPSAQPNELMGLLPRLSSLGMGALGALLLRLKLNDPKLLRNRFAECIAVLVLVFALTYRIPWLFPPCSLFLVLKAFTGYNVKWIDGFLRNRFIVWIGQRSYGIYIFHVPLAYYLKFDWISRASYKLPWSGIAEFIRHNEWIITFPIYTCGTIIIAAISFRWIEQPILKLKDKWFTYSESRVSIPSRSE